MTSNNDQAIPGRSTSWIILKASLCTQPKDVATLGRFNITWVDLHQWLTIGTSGLCRGFPGYFTTDIEHQPLTDYIPARGQLEYAAKKETPCQKKRNSQHRVPSIITHNWKTYKSSTNVNLLMLFSSKGAIFFSNPRHQTIKFASHPAVTAVLLIQSTAKSSWLWTDLAFQRYVRYVKLDGSVGHFARMQWRKIPVKVQESLLKGHCYWVGEHTKIWGTST